ncbi:unnamed protein product [Miscanthus lutarioriparius]|uniref:Uncharacterized protein n=1 Tax=Miscanthus lutarioriparius TaxID=422564 RepID=A0A811RHS5_9POAL|nr:unnamed protein product [Miscanthus lutarioriparius]
MATRALAAAVAGRCAAGHGGLAVLSSGSCCRRGGAVQSFSHSTAEREREGHGDADADADADATVATAAQVEAALNRKNVEAVQGNRSATLVAADAAEALHGVGDSDAAGAEDAWVPDQETGVFVPANEASGDGKNGINGADGGSARGQAGPSVLDQAVFVREEDMEDVERPAVGTVDVVDADAGAK